MLDVPQNGKAQVSNGNRTVRFGVFEVDLRSGELRKSGSRIKLQDQPFKVLQILLEHSGDLVTREELQLRIWPEESFGDFDHAVNVAVGKLRTALGDSADNPSFVETVPRRGYRFVAPLDDAAVETDPTEVSASGAHSSRTLSRLNGTLLAALAILFAVILLGLGVFLGHRIAPSQLPDFQRLTVKHGTVYSARFAPGAYNVIYAASWDGAPIEIFSTELKFPWARSLGLPATQLLAVSSSGEMAVLQGIDHRFLLGVRGTLGQVSVTGGSPRQIAENVEWADWSPDGRTLAVVRATAGKQRLEFPWDVFCTKQRAGSATRGYRRRATKSHFSTTHSTLTTVAPCRSSILRDARKFSLVAGRQRKDWRGLRKEKRFGFRPLQPDSNAASTPSIFRGASA